MPRDSGADTGTKPSSTSGAPAAASVSRISGMCWCSSGLYGLQVHRAHRVVRAGGRRDAAARRAGDADDVHDGAREQARARERQEAELDRRREAAGRRDRARLPDRVAVQLGQAVDEACRAAPGADAARRSSARRRPRRAGGSRPTCRRPSRPRRGSRAPGARSPCAAAPAARRPRRAPPRSGGRFSKRSGLRPGQRRVRRRQRLADVVDRDDADELDVGMDEQPPDELRAAVAGAADDGGLEALHLVDCKPSARSRAHCRRTNRGRATAGNRTSCRPCVTPSRQTTGRAVAHPRILAAHPAHRAAVPCRSRSYLRVGRDRSRAGGRSSKRHDRDDAGERADGRGTTSYIR